MDVNVQLSAGVRDDASLEWALSTGCKRVVVGTSALADPAWCERTVAALGERVVVGLDVRVHEHSGGALQHRLVARGGTRDFGELWPVLAHLDREGCDGYVLTDTSRDGTLLGHNLELYRTVSSATTAPVTASGGIAVLEDVVALATLAATGANLRGAIVGTALYSGAFTLPEALAAARDRSHPPRQSDVGGARSS